MSHVWTSSAFRITLIRWGLSVALLVASLSLASPVYAGGVVGNGTPGSCTEAALTTALAGGGTVTFNCGGLATILVLSEKNITQNTVINGGGVITLTGGLATRLFRVDATASLALSNITLDSAYNSNGSGGAIWSAGPLTLTNTTIQNSQTSLQYCGGALLAAGHVQITNSTFKTNVAGLGGGAICVRSQPGTSVQIAGSSFISNQAVDTTSGFGGAIYVEYGSAAMIGSRFVSNSAHFGGALAVMQGATATLRMGSDTQFTQFNNNSATNSGGATYSQGTLNLSGVSFTSNTVPQSMSALGYGGAVASLGTLWLSDGGFSLNQGRFGGGLYVGSNAGTSRAEINRTSFVFNSAGAHGGGLYTNAATGVITVTNSSFLRNSAALNGGGVARGDAQLQIWDSSFRLNTAATGGGLYVGSGPTYVQVRSVTFTGNEANNNQGGGVYNTGLVELYFTTIVSNTNGVVSVLGGNTRFRNSVLHNPGSLNCDGDGTAQISNDAANHVSDNSCGPQFTAAGDPLLGPLQSGGSNTTYYHLPLAGSPLINAGYSNCPVRDQRGALRPDACDIGAVEYGGLLPKIYLPLLIK
jgi:predicted outer membrane repeat protein